MIWHIRRRFFYFCSVGLGFLVLYLLMYPGVIFNFTRGYIGGFRGDAGIYIWITKAAAQQIFAWPSVGFDAGIFYPFGNSLAYTDNYLLPALCSFLLTSLGLGTQAAYNATLVLAAILNGVCVYQLAREVFEERWIAFYCGFVFMCFIV